MATTSQQAHQVTDYAFALLKRLLGDEPTDSFVIQTKGTEGSVTVPNTVSLTGVDPKFHSFRFFDANVEISFGVN